MFDYFFLRYWNAMDKKRREVLCVRVCLNRIEHDYSKHFWENLLKMHPLWYKFGYCTRLKRGMLFVQGKKRIWMTTIIRRNGQKLVNFHHELLWILIFKSYSKLSLFSFIFSDFVVTQLLIYISNNIRLFKISCIHTGWVEIIWQSKTQHNRNV